jgi:hypothetical protein
MKKKGMWQEDDVQPYVLAMERRKRFGSTSSSKSCGALYLNRGPLFLNRGQAAARIPSSI